MKVLQTSVLACKSTKSDLDVIILMAISYNHHVFVGDIGKTSKSYFSCGKGGSLPKGVTSAIPGMSSPKGAAKPAGGMSGMAGHSGRSINRVKRQFSGGMPMAQIFGSGDDGGAIQYAVKGMDNKVGFYVSPKDIIFSSSEFIVCVPICSLGRAILTP
jgi:hypothetical protein